MQLSVQRVAIALSIELVNIACDKSKHCMCYDVNQSLDRPVSYFSKPFSWKRVYTERVHQYLHSSSTILLYWLKAKCINHIFGNELFDGKSYNWLFNIVFYIPDKLDLGISPISFATLAPEPKDSKVQTFFYWLKMCGRLQGQKSWAFFLLARLE